VLLASFVAIEARAPHPLLPLRVLGDRARGGAFLAVGLAAVGMFAVFLFLTYYLQRTKGFSPIETGLAFLPMSAAVMATAMAVNVVLLRRLGPRRLLTFGMLGGAGGLVWLAQLTPDSGYLGDVLPPVLVIAVGMGSVFGAAFQTATHGVAVHDTGVASATLNTMQQVGGAVGTALLSSIFAGAVTSYTDGKHVTPEVLDAAAVHGYTVAFWVAAGIFVAGALLVGLTMPGVRVLPVRGAEAAPQPAAS